MSPAALDLCAGRPLTCVSGVSREFGDEAPATPDPHTASVLSTAWVYGEGLVPFVSSDFDQYVCVLDGELTIRRAPPKEMHV